MRAEKASFEVSAMARLFGVTRQGYYAYVKRPPSSRVEADAALCREAKQVFEEFEARYGSPRVHRELCNRGFRVGKRRVERALRGMGLSAARPRRRYRTSVRDLSHPVAPNLLARDFDAQRPDERWVTDITYVWTQAGWVYFAAILDLYSRAVVGWAVDTTLTARLALRALEAAVTRRRPGAGLLHHSDRGCQYTGHDYRGALAALGVTVSMSRKGNCWDNAVAESFFATLKTELIHRRSWNDIDEVRRHAFEYIEVFYNRRRLHSALDYKTPAAVEEEYAAAA